MKGNAIVQQIRHGKKSQTESAVTSAIKAHVLRRLSEEKKRLVAEHFADLDEGCDCEDDDDLEEDCDDEESLVEGSRETYIVQLKKRGVSWRKAEVKARQSKDDAGAKKAAAHAEYSEQMARLEQELLDLIAKNVRGSVSQKDFTTQRDRIHKDQKNAKDQWHKELGLHESKLNESTYTVLKTITSHRGYGQFIMELPEEPEGWIPRVKAIPSPYAYSPTDAVYIWKGKKVITRETAHKKYQVFEIPADVHVYDNEHDAETHHVNQK